MVEETVVVAPAAPLPLAVVVDPEVVPVVVPVPDVAPEEAVEVALVVEADVELVVVVDAEVAVVPPVEVDVAVEGFVVVDGFLVMEPDAVAVLLPVAAVVAVSADALDPSEEDPHPVTEKAQAAVAAKTRRLRFIPEKLIFNARTAVI